ncbi:hypothetical protein PAPHI01_0293 [Pancytospora philotis]|nr:hypothetical protein PAPHI01_0293 [Pancytospora philotis]
MTPPELVCTEINHPLCSVFDYEKSDYYSETQNPFGVPVESPYTLSLLIIFSCCAVRMISHVNSMHASIGKGEMRTFFLLYIAANALQFALVGMGHLMAPSVVQLLAVLQVGSNSAMYFAIFIAGMTIDRIYGIVGMKSSTFMRILTTLYFAAVSSMVFLSCNVQNDFVIVLAIAINALWLLSYLVLQLPKLRKINSDIWAYGILALICITAVIVNLFSFVGGRPITQVTDGNLDNLFFQTLFTFLVIMLIHKYWLNTCDFELECLALNV